MEERRRDLVYPAAVRERIERIAPSIAPPMTREELAARPEALAEVDLLFTGWGAPALTDDLLDHAPGLTGVFMAAGSVRGVTTPQFWNRGIPIVSAAAANARPVVEFSFAHVLLGLKQAHRMARQMRVVPWPDKSGVLGVDGATVGVVSLGLIGRGLVDKLRTIDVHPLAYDPYAPADGDLELASLEEVFSRSQVVSLHTPLLPETTGLISGDLVRRLPWGGTLINTARGGVVDEPALIDVLRERPDLTAVLDVTDPEPPSPDSPLRTLPNAVLTAHLAGSHGRECQRLGELVADEAERLVAGEPLQHVVAPATAHLRA
jgi:phosphoglycerate dehydrogenase-like enzyme